MKFMTVLREPASRAISGFFDGFHDCPNFAQKHNISIMNTRQPGMSKLSTGNRCDNSDHPSGRTKGYTAATLPLLDSTSPSLHPPGPSIHCSSILPSLKHRTTAIVILIRYVDTRTISDETVLEYGRCVQCVMINLISGLGRFTSGCPTRLAKLKISTDTAIRRIQKYDFVGLTERFNESLTLFTKLHNADPPKPWELKSMRQAKQSEDPVVLAEHFRIARLLRSMTFHDDHVYAAGVARFLALGDAVRM